MIKDKDGTTVNSSFRIFGNNFRLIYKDPLIADYLNKELQLYPSADQDDSDIIVEISTSKLPAVEPSDKNLLGTINTILATTNFYGNGENCTAINFRLTVPINKLHSAIQRWMSLGYDDRIERIGQIFHEQVLVPASFLMKNKSPLHGSCVQIGEKTIIFGGKGGVGKTSLELEFCRDGNGVFVTDDMVVLDKQCMVYPNLNFPKIYAYNVVGYKGMEEQILEGRTFFDRLHWKVRSFYNLAKARRRLSPDQLFGTYVSQPLKATHYFILKRSNTAEIVFTELGAEEAATESVSILIDEFKTLLRDETEDGAFLKELLSKRWHEVLKKVFMNIKCTEVQIPANMDHAKFRKKLRGLITQDQ